MKPTILEGDRIFVNKLAYDLRIPFTTRHLASWADPTRGDIVVLNSPDDKTRLVKRIVGVPGDSVAMVANRLVVNQLPVEYELLSAPTEGGEAALEPQILVVEDLGGAVEPGVALAEICAEKSPTCEDERRVIDANLSGALRPRNVVTARPDQSSTAPNSSRS